MNFPRPIMSLSELVNETNLPRSLLKTIPHMPNQRIAFQNKGGRKFFFDTQELSKFLDKQKERVGRT